MESKMFVCLMAILVLMAVTDSRSSPFENEKQQKSDAQMYYDQFPVESKCALWRYQNHKATEMMMMMMMPQK